MLVCCFVFAGVQAQKITHEYNNVSLSEALRQLNEQTEEYTISFLYNELEDFRITTSVHRKTIPDAIRQMIGFYPIRMTVEPGIANPSQQEIIVECPQKTAYEILRSDWSSDVCSSDLHDTGGHCPCSAYACAQ